jgi:redox-sensitive bicupin YhaK (pirin superfamily)
MAGSDRKIVGLLEGRPTMEGAGVRLLRVFGFSDASLTDPFLLLDHFGSANPEDYLAGFPWHPHRGIETVTYMIDGVVEHGDSLGNKGVISSGDIQWMTAGSGIIHQEMPQLFEGVMRGLQLWVNLPAADKMTSPEYRGVTAGQVPEVILDDIMFKVVAGEIGGTTGPVGDLVISTTYLDITVPPGVAYRLPVERDQTTFAYVFQGDGYFDEERGRAIHQNQLALLADGDRVFFSAGDRGMRFILVSGRPLREPVAWRGPIVMNTAEELDQAFREYREGTFIKHDVR